jgi:hypothetical protein
MELENNDPLDDVIEDAVNDSQAPAEVEADASRGD